MIVTSCEDYIWPALHALDALFRTGLSEKCVLNLSVTRTI